MSDDVTSVPGDAPVPSVWQTCIPPVTSAWFEALIEINPMLESEAVRARLETFVEALVDVLIEEPFQVERAQALGTRLEMMDSMQVEDLQAVQSGLAGAFARELPPDLWDARRDVITRMLFALGAGFFAGKVERAKRYDMSAMSKMGHDLKTPINAITGFSRVILKGIDGPITDFQREDLTSIYNAGQKLLTMIDDVFNVRKRDAAHTLVYPPSFSVAELLGDLVYTVQPMAADREHTLDLHVTGELGEMRAHASTVRWILLSLLRHAVRQPEGRAISLSAAPDAEQTGWLTFEIGYRLPEGGEVEENAASEAEDNEDWASSEIAFITCRRFCDALGGTVTQSQDEKRVRFTVRLPVAPVSDEDQDGAPHPEDASV
jgi:signal transduction histidine kinase